VSGSSDVVGSDRARVFGAIGAARSKLEGATLLASRQPDGVKMEIGAGDGAGTIWLIGYDGQHRTSVTSGENGGRSLLEANIVRSLQSVGRWRGAPLRELGLLPTGEHAAIIVQADDGRIISAARVSEADAGALGATTE
jgi:hypothetical protein